jgi:hypothetical protein
LGINILASKPFLSLGVLKGSNVFGRLMLAEKIVADTRLGSFFALVAAS